MPSNGFNSCRQPEALAATCGGDESKRIPAAGSDGRPGGASCAYVDAQLPWPAFGMGPVGSRSRRTRILAGMQPGPGPSCRVADGVVFRRATVTPWMSRSSQVRTTRRGRYVRAATTRTNLGWNVYKAESNGKLCLDRTASSPSLPSGFFGEP